MQNRAILECSGRSSFSTYVQAHAQYAKTIMDIPIIMTGPKYHGDDVIKARGMIGRLQVVVCWHGNSMGMGNSQDCHMVGYYDPCRPASVAHSIPTHQENGLLTTVRN